MNPAKRFLIVFGLTYFGALCLGVALFGSSNYSKEYLERYGTDHERYSKIQESEEYKAYAERPALHSPGERLLAEIKFVKEYEARPKFQRERRRMSLFTIYAKVVNNVAFVVVLVYFLRKPLATFLDEKIRGIKDSLEQARLAREAAARQKDEAQHKLDHWPQTQERIVKETDATIGHQLAQIHEEDEQARTMVARTAADRKEAAAARAARLVQQELVTQAIRAIEERYKTSASEQKLDQHVNDFVRLLERLS